MRDPFKALLDLADEFPPLPPDASSKKKRASPPVRKLVPKKPPKPKAKKTPPPRPVPKPKPKTWTQMRDERQLATDNLVLEAIRQGHSTREKLLEVTDLGPQGLTNSLFRLRLGRVTYDRGRYVEVTPASDTAHS